MVAGRFLFDMAFPGLNPTLGNQSLRDHAPRFARARERPPQPAPDAYPVRSMSRNAAHDRFGCSKHC